MLSVSDILKILDKIPLWKTLGNMPKQIADLEKRVIDLENASKTPAKSPGRPCEFCGEPAMRMVKSIPDSDFGDMGVNLETWECEACGKQETASNQ